MLNFHKLNSFTHGLRMRTWIDRLPQQIHQALDSKRHGDLERWQAVLGQLPDITPSSYDLNTTPLRFDHPAAGPLQANAQVVP